MTPTAVVEAFIAAWNRMDFDGVMGWLAADIRYHNIPMQPLVGWDAVRDYLAAAWRFDAVDWQTLALAETADGRVLTERIDSFVIQGQRIDLPLMGIFEISADRITAWRDYFDLAMYRQQLATISAD